MKADAPKGRGSFSSNAGSIVLGLLLYDADAAGVSYFPLPPTMRCIGPHHPLMGQFE